MTLRADGEVPADSHCALLRSSFMHKTDDTRNQQQLMMSLIITTLAT